jgi:hypothetical protein
MAYELFSRKSVKASEPRLTLRSDQIALNAAAADLITGKGAKWVHILWDPTKRKMAIRPALKSDGDTYYLSIRKGKRGGVLSASSFLRYIEWPIGSAPLAIQPEWNDRDRVLEVALPQLSSKSETLTRPKSKSTKETP